MRSYTVGCSAVEGKKDYYLYLSNALPLLLKPGVLRGHAGTPDLHVLHLQTCTDEGDRLHCVVVADHPVNEIEQERLLVGAIEYLMRKLALSRVSDATSGWIREQAHGG